MRGFVLAGLLLAAPVQAATDHGFWLATDNSAPLAEGMVDHLAGWQREIPSLRLLLVFGKYNRIPQALARLAPLGLPIGVQTIGSGYEQDADRVWEQADYSHPDACPVLAPHTSDCCEPIGLCTSSLHMAAMTAPSTAGVWKRWLDFARNRSQVFTVSYPDSVWPWGTRGAPGRAGYSPPTLAAFRADLAGRDEKLWVQGTGKTPRLLGFADYAAFYLGAKPTPVRFGLTDWSAWHPPATALQELTVANRSRPTAAWQHDPQLTLFDLLVCYEWLKFQQRLGQYARSQRPDLTYQLIANPEFIGAGTDFKWLARLATPLFAAQEWFGAAAVADGAYVNASYYAAPLSPSLAVGVSFEAGEGGNSAPYHEVETAYALAYDVSAAVGASWLEADFLPQMPPAEMVRLCFKEQPDCSFYRRALGLRAYGLGYKDFQQDGPISRPADLLAITSRNHFRPYSVGWRPWEWAPGGNYDNSAASLVELGYLLRGSGEDSEMAATFNRVRTVLYEPLFPLQSGWQQVRSWLASGRRTVLTTAGPWSRSSLDSSGRFVPSVEPLLRLAPPGQCPAGSLPSATQPFTVYPLADTGNWQTLVRCGDLAVVSSRTVGRGRLVFVHIDPAEAAVRETRLLPELYRYLLPRLGLVASIDAPSASVHLYDAPHYQIAAVRSRTLDRTGPWRSTSRMSVSLKVQPGGVYRLRQLLNDEEQQLQADKNGWIRFDVRNHYELVFLQSARNVPDNAWGALRERSRHLGRLFAANRDPRTWAP